MNENELTHELHRVANAVPVPDDLYSPELLTRRPKARTRSRWLVAAAAAAALVAFLVTPLGARAVTAASQLIMQYTVKVIKVDKESSPVVSPDTRFIQPGQTLVNEKPGFYKVVATCFLLKELEEKIPLPAYKGPGPEAKVIREIGYKPQSDIAFYTSLSVQWPVDGHTLWYWQVRQESPRPAKPETIKVYTYSEVPRVEEKAVTLKGQAATAHKVGKTWSLMWWHEKGGGSIAGDIELDELLKIAESLPELK
ncbi:MAG TPA: hypothetical protein VNT75_11990 [Symbiobacteriaceae bacterium]|nr:hypothetical protein [Symbiobacteriaceae bacterium]